MATLTTVYGDQYTDAHIDVPAESLDPTLDGGKVRRKYGSYTVDSADEFGTSGLIKMFKLPKGARIIDASLVIPAAGATGIVDVGWDGGTNSLETADADGLFASADPGAAAVDAKLDKTLAGYNRKFVDEVTIQIDVSEATADSGGDTWELEVLYVIE